jgi:ubiquinone/menaquinone biosynthesis C-methylase UbiE
MAPASVMTGTRTAEKVGMLPDSDKAVQAQRQYYTDTAKVYDGMHAREAGDDYGNLKLICALLRVTGAHTVLDVGAGTGRAIRHLLDAIPDLEIRGIEPVPALIEQAVHKNGIPEGIIIPGVGEALPFEDASFDVVCSFGILHHVPRPESVIREMLRVARSAVIISDSNRFGQGSWPMRVLKLGLYKMHLWGVVNYLKTSGKGYLVSPGDGVAYSYSVYDSFGQIADWADRTILIPGEVSKTRSWFHPLLTAGTVLICGLKEETDSLNEPE